MAEEQKRLVPMFDIDDSDAEVVEGTGFEPGVRYTFTIEKPPSGKFMQFGQAKGGLLVLSKKCPEELSKAYHAHPDSFEIFAPGEIAGMQGLIPGKDFEQFAPYLSKIIDVAWVCNMETGKRLVFMSVNAGGRQSVNTGKPEFESQAVRLSRKMGYIPPEPKNKDGTPNKEKFSFSAFLHPGVTITSEVVKVKQKNKDGTEKLVDKLDVDTIEPASADGSKPEAQQKIKEAELDPEIKMRVVDLAAGCKTTSEVIKKVKADLKASDELGQLGAYAAAIQTLKDRKEILA